MVDTFSRRSKSLLLTCWNYGAKVLKLVFIKALLSKVALSRQVMTQVGWGRVGRRDLSGFLLCWTDHLNCLSCGKILSVEWVRMWGGKQEKPRSRRTRRCCGERWSTGWPWSGPAWSDHQQLAGLQWNLRLLQREAMLSWWACLALGSFQCKIGLDWPNRFPCCVFSSYFSLVFVVDSTYIQLTNPSQKSSLSRAIN